jgi:hypothetical protein
VICWIIGSPDRSDRVNRMLLARRGDARCLQVDLSAQLTDLKRRHREETAALRQALEQAHGENLLLRRRLAGHGNDQAPAGQ